MIEESIKERRSNQLIENMLAERKQLLALLFQLPEIDKKASTLEKRDLIQDFCQVLVDYIAAGHFGLYARIAEGQERRKAVSDLAASIYPDIEKTTETALEFNEKYDVDNSLMHAQSMQSDLSKLGEEITNRIELEDQLIKKILE